MLPSDQEKPVILVVDDTPDNLSLLSELLRSDYQVKVATRGEKALQIVQSGATPRPDLILLDVVMPGMDGHAVCRHLKNDASTADIPVIFLTSRSEATDEEYGLSLGAVDYITKPISPAIVRARLRTHLKLKASTDALRHRNDDLEAEVRRRTAEITAIQDVTILTLASLAETRDSDTGNHIRRTQHYIKALATHLRQHPRFAGTLDDHMIDMLFKSAPLHDIGKVGIPDRILLKPGRFEPHEFEQMKRHAELGKQAIEQAERELGTAVEFLSIAKQIAHGHHEKWDGSGYPQGLAGDAIPVAARLMALADVYDALISRRVYKAGMPHAKAAAIIAEGRGTHFDPDMVDAFLALDEEIQAIAKRYADSDAHLQEKAAQHRAALPDADTVQ